MEACKFDAVEFSGYDFDIWTAASVGDLDFVRECLTPELSFDVVNKSGWSALLYASYYDHPQIVAFLLSLGAKVNFGSKTALMLAASCGLIETMKVLIHVGEALENEAQDDNGHTALFHAVASDHHEACRLLLESGTKIDVQDELNQSTPLQIACQDGHERIVTLLLKHGADPTYRNQDGYTAGDLALQNGHGRLAKCLMGM